jgi:ribonuclease BN (tRNA processing enzyme)
MEELKVQVLGCGDAFSSGGRLNTSFFLTNSRLKLLVDCGLTATTSLKRQNIQVDEVDYIIITHFHGDHFGGLPLFLLENSRVLKRKKPLTIISPPGCQDRLSSLMEILYPGTVDILRKPFLHFVEYNSEIDIDSEFFRLKTFPVVHSEYSFPHGIRLSIGSKIFSYSGDTSWTDNLINLAKGANLFLCECNFYDTELEGHLNYETLLKNRHLFECKELMLTHLGAEMMERLGELEIPYAEDGKIVFL